MSSAVLTLPRQSVHRSEGPSDRECRIVALASHRRGDWQAFIDRCADATVFHTLAWHDAVAEGFPHEDVYLMAYRGEHVVGVLPMFLVNSFLAGRTLVSLPYAVGGGILGNDEDAVAQLFAEAKRIAECRQCVTIDLRSAKAVLPDVPIVDRYVGFERELPGRSDDVLGWLPRKARAAARNARSKFGLTASFGDEHLREVWRLYSISMRRLGSLAYSFSFFERLAGHFAEQHWTCLVRYQGRPVAGLFTLLFRDRVMPYFVGTSRVAKRCSAANFIYLVTMERAVSEGFGVFDFGRSRRDNTGSYDFKRFHGFEPRPLEYQQYSLGLPARELTPSNPAFAAARRVFRYLPLPVTRVLGARLANHIPG